MSKKKERFGDPNLLTKEQKKIEPSTEGRLPVLRFFIIAIKNTIF